MLCPARPCAHYGLLPIADRLLPPKKILTVSSKMTNYHCTIRQRWLQRRPAPPMIAAETTQTTTSRQSLKINLTPKTATHSRKAPIFAIPRPSFFDLPSRIIITTIMSNMNHVSFMIWPTIGQKCGARYFVALSLASANIFPKSRFIMSPAYHFYRIVSNGFGFLHSS